MEAGAERYDVVVLVEQTLTPADAKVVWQLHEGLDDQVVHYHLLLPMEDAAAAVEASMGALGGHDLVVPPPSVNAEEIQVLREQCRSDAEKALGASLEWPPDGPSPSSP